MILSDFTKLKHVKLLSHVTFLMTKLFQATVYIELYMEQIKFLLGQEVKKWIYTQGIKQYPN